MGRGLIQWLRSHPTWDRYLGTLKIKFPLLLCSTWAIWDLLTPYPSLTCTFTPDQQNFLLKKYPSSSD